MTMPSSAMILPAWPIRSINSAWRHGRHEEVMLHHQHVVVGIQVGPRWRWCSSAWRRRTPDAAGEEPSGQRTRPAAMTAGAMEMMVTRIQMPRREAAMKTDPVCQISRGRFQWLEKGRRP